MGAVLGVAAWSRGQEKITAMNQGGYQNRPYNTSNNNRPMVVPQAPDREL
jgi:hypothetical protein